MVDWNNVLFVILGREVLQPKKSWTFFHFGIRSLKLSPALHTNYKSLAGLRSWQCVARMYWSKLPVRQASGCIGPGRNAS